MKKKVVHHSIETEHKQEVTKADVLVGALFTGYVLSAILALYRVVVLVLWTNLGNLVAVVNHISAIVAFLSLSLWLRMYGYYRSALLKGGVEVFSEFSIMKVLSFIAGLCCVLRIVVSVVYFLHLEETNALTNIYVAIELALWAALAVFFFYFWNDRRQRVNHLVAKDNSIKR